MNAEPARRDGQGFVLRRGRLRWGWRCGFVIHWLSLPNVHRLTARARCRHSGAFPFVPEMPVTHPFVGRLTARPSQRLIQVRYAALFRFPFL
jgi:hypothetical protein